MTMSIALMALMGFGASNLTEPDAFGDAFKKILTRYGELHAGLARDDASRIPGEARILEEEARKATGLSPSDYKESLLGLAKAAKQLAEDRSGSLVALRKYFGEVSRAVIEILTKAPSLRDSHTLFSCPMVPQGSFGRWVQPKGTLENPYMGTRMLRCGMKLEWQG